MLIGDSGAGKTGALCSLAAAGYKVRVIDLDNGMDICKAYLTNPTSRYLRENPKAAENFDYVTFTDKMKTIAGIPYYAKAEAWQQTMEQLMDWKEKDAAGNVINHYGSVYTWGPDCVLVIDSLTSLAQYALNHVLALEVALQKTRTGRENQRDIFSTQNQLRKLLDMFKDKRLLCNVVVTAHITVANEMGDAPARDDQGAREPGQGYPSSIGRAIAPQIPRYFNTMLVARTIGAGTGARHEIHTSSQLIAGNTVNAKSSNPIGVKPKYDLATGLAEYFKDVKGQGVPAIAEPPK